MKCELYLPYPPSVNQLYLNAPGKGRVKTPKYREWIEKASELVGVQDPPQLKGWVSVYAQVIKPDGRRRDIMNLEKGISDLLCVHRVIEDDSYITVGKLAWVKLEKTNWPNFTLRDERITPWCKVIIRETDEYDTQV